MKPSRTLIIAIACIAATEALAFAAWRAPAFAPWAFGMVALVVLAATLVDLRYGVLIAIGELAVGGFGYLFALPLGGVNLSIRMAIFLIVVGVWIVKRGQRFYRDRVAVGTVNRQRGDLSTSSQRSVAQDDRKRNRFPQVSRWFESPYAIPTLALGAAVGWGIVRGVIGKNDPAAIFFDANGFLFFLYAPIFYETLSGRVRIREAIHIAFTCVLWLAAEVSVLAFIFSHGMSSLAVPLYKFVRDTRVGEITPAGGEVFRFFLQSQVYLIPALLVIFAALALRRGTTYPHPRPQGERGSPLTLTLSRGEREAKRRDRLIALSALLTAVFLLTFSRSFWIGMAMALVALAVWLIWKLRVQGKDFLLWIGKLLAILFFAFGILLTLVNFPYPLKRTVSPIASLIASRAGSTGDAAASSRWALLPVLWDAVASDAFFGRGFGATLTYVTQDPRVRASNPSGEYTTFAFEWAWLDLWLKTGVFGVAAYLWLLATLVRRGIAAVREAVRAKLPSHLSSPLAGEVAIRLGLTLGVLAFAVVNIFTPYLNHPLGIGYLIFTAACCRQFPRDRG